MNSDSAKQSTNKSSNIAFTTREAQCIVELLNGLNVKEIAQKLTLHEQTIRFFIRKIIRKSGCTTLEEALNKIKQNTLITDKL